MILDQHGKPIDTAKLNAARKQQARAARADSLNAAYDAAAYTQENAKHWQFTDSKSAKSANNSSVRKTLRQRSRYECLENNSFAKGIALTLANDTIATGPSLQITLPDRSVGSAIEQRWRKWCRDVNLGRKLHTARLAKIIDGETFILKGTNRRSKNDVKLDIRIIEAEQIATPNYIDSMPDKIDGIEFDEWGNVINYHMLKGHPGDLWPWGAWEKDDVDPYDLIHMFRCERPGQVRGIPEMATALPLFALLRRFTLAVILAAETAADFTAILSTQANAFDSSSDGVDDIDPFDFAQIDRGLMTSLPKGWQLQQFKAEQPTTTYEMFRNAILNEVARCVHMPSNKALADSSRYNYSSGRLDHQTYYESISVERSWWEIECLDRIFEWWLDEALMLDGFLPGMEPVEFIPHVWRWPPNRDVDPKDQAEANVLMIQNGLKTRAQYLLEQNIDPEQHAEQLKAENWVDPNQPVPVDDAASVDPLAEPVPASPVTDVAKMAFNGAQVASLVQLVQAVAIGTLPKETAKAMIASAFPALSPETIDSIIDPVTPGSVSADGQAIAVPQDLKDPDNANPDEPPPTGEFANMSQLQLNRNMKGIDDALSKLSTGEWTVSRARIFLSALGLTVRTVDNLLREFETADVQPDV